MFESDWWLPVCGLIIGTILGAAARWNHFCTLSSLERMWYADDDGGFRTWIFAIVIAIASTQLLLASGYIELEQSFYLQPRLSLIGVIVGGVLFGLGMAMVGTCGFGALVRLGGGSIRSLVIVAAMGFAAVVTQRGLLGRFRDAYIEPAALDLSSAGTSSIADIMYGLAGIQLQFVIAAVIVAGLLVWLFANHSFRQDTRAIITGAVIGLCVTAGWLITEHFYHHSFDFVQVESASFVLPPGELIFSLAAANSSIPDYGIALVPGVVMGAAIIAFARREIRLEACDDARELNRHLAGAFLMGIGGVLAGGCTIGQGVSAASTLSISAPIAFLSILSGARIGLRVLIEGSMSTHDRAA